MSLGINIFANYVSQIYVTLIGIVMVPLYIHYMGAEAYGLVGFYAVLQAWFNLLDIGLTPTVAREAARHQGGASSATEFRRLVRTLEGVFIALGVPATTALLLTSGYFAEHWLQAADLPAHEVNRAVQLMAIIIALRWIGGLYRGIISGAQRLVWLGAFNTVAATVRFAGVLPLLILVGATPTLFFGFQLVIAILEFAVLTLHAYQLMPAAHPKLHESWSWSPLRPVLKFSLGVAFSAAVSVLVTQTDKLVLSKLLPLAEFGYYSLAVLVASGIMLLSGPVSGAIMPRMAKLEALGDHQGLIQVYREGTQLVSVLAGSAAITLAMCAEPLLWAWTGDRTIASQAAPILALYALGNGVLAVAGFPYYLQYAKGDLRLHLIGNAVFVIVLLPVIVWAASRHGALGAGYAWLGMNLLSLVAWLPLVHRKFEPGLNIRWYGTDVSVIFLGAAAAAFLLHPVLSDLDNRWAQFFQVAAIGTVVTLAGGLSSSMLRGHAMRLLRKHRNAAKT